MLVLRIFVSIILLSGCFQDQLASYTRRDPYGWRNINSGFDEQFITEFICDVDVNPCVFGSRMHISLRTMRPMFYYLFFARSYFLLFLTETHPHAGRVPKKSKEKPLSCPVSSQLQGITQNQSRETMHIEHEKTTYQFDGIHRQMAVKTRVNQ